MQKRYKLVKSERQLYRWKKYLSGGGTKLEKTAKIKGCVLQKFKTCIRSGLVVHDRDIRKWALESANTLGITSFKAFKFWLAQFKKEDNIVSRKITKFVTKKSIENQQEINQSAETFVRDVRDAI